MFGDIPRVDSPPTTDSPDAPGHLGGAVTVVAIWVAAIGGAVAATTFRSFDLDRFFGPKELALHIGALGIVVVLAMQLRDRRYTRADLALIAWLGLSLVSAMFATSSWHAARALTISLSAAVVFWGASALRDAGRGRAVVLALATSAVLAVGSALAQAYGYEHDIFAANRSPGGLLGNRNFIAHIAAMALPLLTYLAATARSPVGTLGGAAAILLMAAALVLSRTRAAWLAIAVWLLLAIPIAWQGRGVIRTAMAPRRGLLLAGSLVAGIVLALTVPNTLDWRSDSPYLDSVRDVVNYREGSGAGRLRQYTNSLKMARANPVLGVGPGNWAVEYPGYAERNDPSISDATGMAANPWPSSDWVAALAERGVLAGLAMAGLLIVLVTNAWRGWRDSVFSSTDRFAALAGGSAVIIGVVQGGFDAVTLLAFPSVIFWGAAGALIPAGTTVVTRKITRDERVYLSGIAAIAWAAIIAMSASKIEAMRLYSKGTYDAIQSAASFDRGAYRIQLRAAELHAERGHCRLAYHNAMAANGLFPRAAAPKAILAKCAGATQ